MQALNIAATGMLAQQTNVEVISNNISNMTTTGFKRHRAEFQDLLYQDLRRVGSNSSDAGTIVPSGIQLGVGTRVASTYRIGEQGALVLTDNPLDVAINGEGFFQIQLPDGDTGYTRDGSFQLNKSGELVNAEGFQLVPNVVIDQSAVGITINQNGQVLLKFDGQTSETIAGTIQIATFQNKAGLEHIGRNLLKITEASGAAITANPGAPGFGAISQGFVEASNVDAAFNKIADAALQTRYHNICIYSALH